MMSRYHSDKLISLLPLPLPEANKYSRGKLLVVAGSAPYPGAACLCAYAGQRAGAGYTEVYTPGQIIPLIQLYRPSLVVRAIDGLVQDGLQASTGERPCAYVTGPGFEAKKGVRKTIAPLLEQVQAPLLIDGGGLFALTSKAAWKLCRERFVEGYPTILTPHEGEAARLAKPFGFPTGDPACLACLLSQAYGATVVLKGPVTYISDGEETYEMAQGTAALAKAGTGDVLSGIVGAFLAQGLDPVDACVLGSTLHAQAGQLAAAALTPLCVTAEDVIVYLPRAIRALVDGADDLTRPQG